MGSVLIPLLGLSSCDDANPAFFQHDASDVLQEPAGPAMGVAGYPLDPVPSVQARDEKGNPVPGVDVLFRVEEGGGSVQPERVVTNREGKASPDVWTLGDEVGQNALVADLGPLGEVRFEAEGKASEPDRLERASADSQEARVGLAVRDPPAVKVWDAFGNPVPDVEVEFEPRGAAGDLVGARQETDSDGVARVEDWRMGDSEGIHEAVAKVDGLGEVSFEANAIALGDGTHGLRVDGVHLNQGSQAEDGSVGGVAGRPGLLRVVLRADEPNSLAPEVRIRLHSDGQVREERVPASRGSVPVNPDLSDPSHTWDLELSADEVTAGLGVEVKVDPAGTISGDRYGFRYPLSGDPRSLDVRPIPPLNVHFIPVHWEGAGRTGAIDPSNVDGFLERTRQWIPTEEIRAEVDEPFVTNRNLGSSEGWVGLLSDLHAVRTDAGATDEYVHGIVPRVRGAPVAGMAYLLTNPESTSRVALTYDDLPRASAIVAHELGHNMGRRHAPCGGPGRVDGHFPYDGADVGPPGYNVRSGELVNPGPRYDYMSYCTPRWTSDYTFEELLEWRRSDPLVEDPGSFPLTDGSSQSATSALLVWGEVGGGRAVLNPAFSVEAPPRLPDRSGPYELRGYDDDGATVFSLSFAGNPVAHGADEEHRHFAFAVPLDRREQERLAEIRLEGPEASAERRPQGRQAGTDGGSGLRADTPGLEVGGGSAGVQAAQAPDGGVRFSWDLDRYEAILVRDRETGRIRGISQSGALEMPASSTSALEVEVSDGVTSQLRRAEPWAR